MAEQTGKSKQVTVRMTLEDWLILRDAAFSKGLEIGPMVGTWIGPRIKRLKLKRMPAVATIDTTDDGRPPS